MFNYKYSLIGTS